MRTPLPYPTTIHWEIDKIAFEYLLPKFQEFVFLLPEDRFSYNRQPVVFANHNRLKLE